MRELVGCRTRNGLVNGSLVILGIPEDIINPIGRYIVFYKINDLAYYWGITDEQPEAAMLAAHLVGYWVRVDTWEV